MGSEAVTRHPKKLIVIPLPASVPRAGKPQRQAEPSNAENGCNRCGGFSACRRGERSP